ncbi:MAG: Gx transporter family protein, partial [Candidatus Omnitrophica bacterium]|nr:Gx transporter family protein [Candidatus Omnitrophota bacterium]
NVYKIAMLVSLSCVLQISESLIPHPIPGLRLGLANCMTLIALVTLGFGPALEVAILRTILSSFIMGTFMSPTFILSFSGAFVSTLVMGLLYWLSGFHHHYRLSIVGISILSALSHNLVQLYLAYLILVRHKGIFVFLPWLCIGAVLMGWLTGVVAGNVCLKLKNQDALKLIIAKNPKEHSLLEFRHYFPGHSYIHRLRADLKIMGIFLLSFVVLIFANPWLYLALFLFLIVLTLASATPFSFLFFKMKKSVLLIFASFLFPLFFNSGKHILLNMVYFKLTSEGLTLGAIFALRVLFLIMISTLLVRTTSPQDLTRGLSKVLSPLRFMGISQQRTADILSLSWMAIPVFWEMARNAIRAADLKNIKSLRNLIPLLSEIIAYLYLETEKVGVFGGNNNLIKERQEILRKEGGSYYKNDLDSITIVSEA